MSDVEETIAVPKKAIDYIMGAGPDHEGYWLGSPDTPGVGQFRWRTRFKMMLEATPKPDPSPVCVEVRELEWLYYPGLSNGRDGWVADDPFGRHTIVAWSDGTYRCAPLCNDGVGFSSLEAAQAAYKADFTRRTLELVNARSVESVRAERDRELEPVFAALKKHHDQALSVGSVIFPAEPDMPEPVEIDLSEAYADSSIYEETVAALALRSLTEGEG